MQHMTSRWQCGKEFKLIERQLQKNTIIMWAGRRGWKLVSDWSDVMFIDT